MVTTTCLKIRFAETTQIGVVHDSNIPIWFEVGRDDYFRKAGISNSKIEASGFYIPLSSIEYKITNPAKYDNEIIVVTTLTYMSCVKLKFSYMAINKHDRKVLATGRTVHAWTNKNIEPINIQKAAPGIHGLLQKSINSE
jgi:acyl-CoA thioester hydrolase